MTYYLLPILPACFSDTGDLAFVSEFPEANSANAELAEISVWSSADLTSIVSACRVFRLS
jgi:hypothetical protein